MPCHTHVRRATRIAQFASRPCTSAAFSRVSRSLRPTRTTATMSMTETESDAVLEAPSLSAAEIRRAPTSGDTTVRRDRTDGAIGAHEGGARPAAPLRAPDGRTVTVVHLVAELAPFARTGGLGEAVASLARFQLASGVPASLVMPLYASVKNQGHEL